MCWGDFLLLLNLSRDQLDRYGEVDIIFDRWQDAFSHLPQKTVVLADSDQELFKQLGGNVIYFNSDSALLKKTRLHGTFNAKNVNAAFKVAKLLNLDLAKVEQSLTTFEVAYGRGELIKYGEQRFQVFLAKNPASFNHNLDIITAGNVVPEALLFVLNDNIPDGRDVSWIYDIDAKKLYEACKDKTIFVSGTRAQDMAIRLKYAGVSVDTANIFTNLKNALTRIPQLEVVVLPNYSAMLEIRKLLLGRSIL